MAVFLAIFRPCHHVGHRARRAVAIEHLQRQFSFCEILLDRFQPQADLPLHHAFGGAIAVQGTADEIVHAGIADVLDDRGIDLAQIDEAARQGLRTSGA